MARDYNFVFKHVQSIETGTWDLCKGMPDYYRDLETTTYVYNTPFLCKI
jgi:hypothetical protein